MAEEMAPSRAIADALDLPSGEAAVMRQRLILLDGRPIELAASYWPAAFASGTPLASTGRIRGGAVSLLAELGYRPGTVTEDIHTRPPTREEAEALQLTDNSEWVLVLTRTISTANGQPYEVSVMISPGRIGRLHYSMKVD
ncbi:UTRA domain-containing protein [Streptomyces actuosus]|uniref:Transcriptional regulator n=2 Tax=Streptomyces TaxID=1883 RepID=A0A2U9PD89_STRAS|nr:transcriptional regulator [Streptomyces actuosus]MBM4819796.1 UTRA domain-containing protein [Streptomyces actuosus]